MNVRLVEPGANCLAGAFRLRILVLGVSFLPAAGVPHWEFHEPNGFGFEAPSYVAICA